MLGALLEALLMALYRIFKGEAHDASIPPKADDLGPPPMFIRDRWNNRVRDYLRGKEGGDSKRK